MNLFWTFFWNSKYSQNESELFKALWNRTQHFAWGSTGRGENINLGKRNKCYYKSNWNWVGGDLLIPGGRTTDFLSNSVWNIFRINLEHFSLFRRFSLFLQHTLPFRSRTITVHEHAFASNACDSLVHIFTFFS